MGLIGYARVSTDNQTTAAQIDALRAAGCARIFEERPPAPRGPGLIWRGPWPA